MTNQIDQFRELLSFGVKGGTFYLPTATGRTIQMKFTKDPTSKKFILQCYDGSNWLWTSYDNISKNLIRDFDQIVSQYTEL
jgi:hypothetical protein